MKTLSLPGLSVPTALFLNGGKACQHGGQRGVSLIIVIMLLVIVSLLGIAATQIAIQGERAARNDRDRQIAHQAAEAALLDAEFDIEGTSPVTGAVKRASLFGVAFSSGFVAGCGDGDGDGEESATSNKGLCAVAADGKPAWLTLDLTKESETRLVPFGAFTKRSFPTNTVGLAPARLPRYLIESIPDMGANRDASSLNAQAYRITAVGFGPKDNTYVVLQTVYRK